jgi:hypothetical protein
MLKSLLGRRPGERRDADVEARAEGYEILTANLPGRAIIAFQNRVGQVAALEVTDEGAEILRGLAAGAVVSELEDARSSDPLGRSVKLTESRGATREEAEAFISSLELLDTVEKKALQKALPR